MTDLRTDDRQAIHDLLVRYCRGVDRGDGSLVVSCYHPDAIHDHGPSFVGLATDFVDAICIPAFEVYESMMHCLTNELVEFDGTDGAHGESYIVAYTRRRVDGQSRLEILGGRYVDRLELRAGEWRIARRVLVYEWSESRTPDESFPPNVDHFEHGHRYDSDIAYIRVPVRPDRRS